MISRALAVPALLLAALLAVGGCGLATAEPSLSPVEPVLGAEVDRGTETTTTATVVRVIDGDTVKLDDGRTVRVLALDTPETKHPSKPVECFGPEATAFAEARLLGHRVRVAEDSTQDLTDRYGRALASLLLTDGSNYAVVAARAGVAHAYVYDDRPARDYPDVALAEREARAAGTGLWGACPR